MFFLMTRKCETISEVIIVRVYVYSYYKSYVKNRRTQHISIKGITHRRHNKTKIPELLLDDNRISTSHSLTFQL